jgi:hypothetical protein
MKKRLILSAALAMAAAGCKLVEPQVNPSTSGEPCSATTMAAIPSLPQAQIIIAHSVAPSPPPSQYIVASTCEATGTYVATGVDLKAGSFTFFFKGGPSTRSDAFTKLKAAGVPVTLYDAPMMMKTGDQQLEFDPCAASGGTPPHQAAPGIGDDPRDPPVPPGIAEVSWCNANTLEAAK